MKRGERTASEEFEVIEGTMTFKLGRKTIVARAGDVVTVPVGRSLKITNGGFRQAELVVRLPPSNGSK
jgi:mannose-6-phosphate isomerase-like protein (cupin superfamily)